MNREQLQQKITKTIFEVYILTEFYKEKIKEFKN